jgi:hypothetical protein
MTLFVGNCSCRWPLSWGVCRAFKIPIVSATVEPYCGDLLTVIVVFHECPYCHDRIEHIRPVEAIEELDEYFYWG